MTLAVYRGVDPTKDTDARSCAVPVLVAIWWPGIAARRPVPYGSEEPPTIIWFTVVAICGDTTSGVQEAPVPSGLPSSDRKSTRLNSSHANISYAVFCLK